MPEIVLVKLGGSLITDKRRPGTVRRRVLARLAAEVAACARDESRPRLLLGHGSGSFGHVAADRYGLLPGPLSPERLAGVSATQDRAARLHRVVVAALREAGALPYSLPPSACMGAAGGTVVAVRLEPLQRALRLGLLPVVYGDVLMDRLWGASIASTERVLAALVARLRRRGWTIRRAFWLGITPGVYDRRGRTLERVTAADLERHREALQGASGTDVTGGMEHRLETAVALARRGVTSWIVDGREPGVLGRLLAGDAVRGTRIPGRRG